MAGAARRTLEIGWRYYDRLEHMNRLQGGHLFSKQFIEVRLRFSPYIREVMVVGDPARPHVTALVNIDGDVFGRCDRGRR